MQWWLSEVSPLALQSFPGHDATGGNPADHDEDDEMAILVKWQSQGQSLDISASFAIVIASSDLSQAHNMFFLIVFVKIAKCICPFKTELSKFLCIFVQITTCILFNCWNVFWRLAIGIASHDLTPLSTWGSAVYFYFFSTLIKKFRFPTHTAFFPLHWTVSSVDCTACSAL